MSRDEKSAILPENMSTSADLHKKISILRPGDHLCCIYETEEEHRALLTPYIRQGLERNEKVIYIVDARTAETVLEYLREDGLDPSSCLDRGQLVLHTVSDAYMREGAFIPDRMISFLRQETDRAVGEGYGALRVTGEMSWALRRLPGSNPLIEYEAKLNTFLTGSRCLALCQYDRRRFSPEILLGVLATHPIAVIGTEVFDNLHFVPPEVFLTHDFSTAILGHWIEGLRIRRLVKSREDALLESEEQLRAIFENSMDGILVTIPEGGILAANPAACAMLGRTEEEIRKAGRNGVVDLSDPRLPVLLEERARTGVCHGELILVRRDGTTFPVEISSRIHKDRNGNPRTAMILHDITGRKKAEETLRARERELNESQRVARIGSWDWDATTDTIWWSDEYCRIYSVDPKLPTPNYIDHLKVYTLESRERLDAAVKRSMQTGETYVLDLELADPAGPTRCICARGEVKRDSRGRVCGLRGTALDITERKQAEEALHQLVVYNRSLIEASFDPLVTIDAAGKITDVNSATERVTGYPRGRLIATDFSEYFTDPEKARAGYQLVFREGAVQDYPLEIRHRDGSVTPVLYNASVYRDESGKVLGVFAAARNISEQIKTYVALRRSEEELRTILRTATDGFWVTDRQGRLLDVNDSVCRNLGYSRDEMLRMSVSDIEAMEKPEEILRVVRRIIERGSDRFEGIHRCKDGSLRNIEINVTYLPPPHDRFYAFLRDITEHMRAEEEKERLQAQLQQAMKMEAVGRLAGGVAHDFNNLLTVINGYSELLIQRLGEDSPMRKDAEEILQAGNRAESLTRQLLLFSQKQVLQPKVIDLNMVVARTGKMLRRLIGENIELRTILGKGLGRVKADEGQVEQILVNLAINARDAMPGGGELTIETANVVPDEIFTRDHPSLVQGPHVLLSVRDTGIGISDEIRHHIFEPFFTTKERGKGTGLGLATVYGIVHQSGGDLDFRSESGKGTTFNVYLPCADGESETLSTVPTEAPRGSESVLVVEDEDSVREIVNRVLSGKGYRVLMASDGNEGLRISREYDGPIDLLLTDMVMPRMGGRELATRLEAERAGMKVLFMSGYTGDAISHQGVLESGLSFIQKPFRTDALLRKVREVLDGK